MSEGARLRVDVHVPGEPVRRDVAAWVADEAIRVADRVIELEELVWSDRRAGLLLLFSRSVSMALSGREEALDRLAEEVAARVPDEELRRRLVSDLGAGELRLAAGCAVVGRLTGEPVHGLRVAAVTDDGLYLLGPEGVRQMPWPADEADVVQGRGDRRALRLRKDGDMVALHYLGEHEEEAALRAGRSGSGAGVEGSLEMFRQKDVAPPPAAEVPELSVAAESLQPSAEEEAARVPDDLREGAGLGPHFFETHLLELGEIALGPLLLRKSAASGARSLRRALEALDAEELQEDTRAAVARAVKRLSEVYGEELDRLREDRRAPGRVREERELDQDELDRLMARIQGPFDKLAPRFRQLEEEQDRLATRLQELAEGPPGGDDAGVAEVAETWRKALRELDHGFRSAWGDALREVRLAWETLLLPRLGELADMSRRRIPEWAQLALLALATFLVVGAAVLLLGG